MNWKTCRTCMALAIGFVLSLPLAVHAAGVTRTLQQSIAIPAGGSLVVENLAGHMTVTQGNGPAQITATVVAGGGQAEALAQSVKLEVSTVGKELRVHVSYPVDRYSTFLYNPPDARAEGSGEGCILGNLICFHGNSNSTVEYQGTRVRVVESGTGSGAPLYVNVAVHLPPQLNAGFDNAVGLLQADGLADDLALATQGSDIRVGQFRGILDARSRGGDIYLNTVTSSDAQVHADGGDLTGDTLSGNLRLATGGGDAKLNTVSGELALETGGGDVRLGGALSALQTLRAQSGGGNLTVTGDLAALTSLDAGSGGGDIVFRVSGLSLHLEASSGGGDINVTLPDLRNVTSNSDNFSADAGKAAGAASLHSGGGDITVSSN